MNTKLYFIVFSCFLGSFSFSQNVQSDALGTSGGLDAGISSVTGNTFYGYRSGFGTSQSSGYNTFIGASSGMNVSGVAVANICLGYGSGYAISGEENIVIGHGAGNNFTGNSNIYLGTLAGSGAQGANNIYFGYETGTGTIGTGNVFLGNGLGTYATHQNKLMIDNDYIETPLIWGDFAQDQLKFNAKVGIGSGFGSYPTTAGSVNIANYNLFVKGGILTEEVRVSLQTTWADYVFNKDYKLPTLQEVENHIKEKGHLINVPSTKEVAENGIELGEMTKIQQEKIEELTLYTIDQQKQLDKQAEDLKIQAQEIESLKELVNKLIQKINNN